MKLHLLGNKVLVEPAAPGDRTPGGIFLPDSARQDVLLEGTVVSVGPGALDKEGRYVEPRVKKGDRVLYTASAAEIGIPFVSDGKKCIILNARQIVGVVE